MAAGSLPSPGHKFGPCKKACDHKDCASTRETAESTCRYCTKLIGYNTRFYDIGEGVNVHEYVHASCHEDEILNESP